METNTYILSPITSGLAKMLNLAGHDCTEEEIVLGMESPWLFLRDDDRYCAGNGLFRPKWLNLYAHMHGYHLAEVTLSADAVPAFLRTINTAMLQLSISRDLLRTVVFTGYCNGRYAFVTMEPVGNDEPKLLSLSTQMLRRRLSDTVNIITLSLCKAEEADFIPLLFESLQTLDLYQQDLERIRYQYLNRTEFRSLHKPLFRALLLDVLQMAALTGDQTLYQELRLLNHDYRHVFTRLSPEQVQLCERLPYSSIRKCISWLKEDIVDRLYELGVTDEMMAEFNALSQN